MTTVSNLEIGVFFGRQGCSASAHSNWPWLHRGTIRIVVEGSPSPVVAKIELRARVALVFSVVLMKWCGVVLVAGWVVVDPSLGYLDGDDGELLGC